MTAQLMISCAEVNECDAKFKGMCAALATALRMQDTLTASEEQRARLLDAIASSLEREPVCKSELLGKRVTKEFTAKLVGTLAAATVSGAIRSGLTT
jgi:hypothetical protein